MRVPKARWGLFAGLSAGALASDLAVKLLVQQSLSLGEKRELLPFLALHYGVNDGVAFGLLSGRMLFILPVVALALIAVVVYVAHDRSPQTMVAGGFLFGGSLGNQIERVAYGHVTDYLSLPYWPTFNLADIYIVVGTALLILGLLFDLRPGDEDDLSPVASDR